MKGRMTVGGREWKRWCAMYEGASNRRRIRAERSVRRDRLVAIVEEQARDELLDTKAGATHPR